MERTLSASNHLPLRQGGGAAFLECCAVDEVAFLGKVVVERGVNGSELLQQPHLPEAQHRPLSSSERQMAVLGPVVGLAADLLLLGIAELGSTVGVQAIGSDRCA